MTFPVVETFADFDSHARRAATAQDASRVLGGRPVEFASEYLSGPWSTLEDFDQDAGRLDVAEFARRVPVMGGWVVSVSFWRPRPALPRAMTPKQALAALPCPSDGPEGPLDARTAAGETLWSLRPPVSLLGGASALQRRRACRWRHPDQAARRALDVRHPFYAGSARLQVSSPGQDDRSGRFRSPFLDRPAYLRPRRQRGSRSTWH